jgi:type I restriction enzyme S subunit
MAQPKLALKRIENAIIPIPCSEEQKEIVIIVNQLLTFCDELEKKIEKRDSYQERIMQAVVRQAFTTKIETV